MSPIRFTRVIATFIASLSLLVAHAVGSGSTADIFPDQIKWVALPKAIAPGAEVTILKGPLDKPGDLYELRVRLRNGGMIKPHTHPDTRYVTVLSGELHAGRGEAIDEKSTTRYPAGSFFVVPAGIVHFTWARNGEVVYQESGIGPTANDFLKE
ncbi:MAG: cupin domain-containing protein [Acidiferrobacterales bacterium]